jgi:ubiquitin-like 1-activating enzyme E1 A
MPAVNAVLGGIAANELVKAVTAKGEPLNNFFFFSLTDGAGIVERFG